jgi:hypothetical protein
MRVSKVADDEKQAAPCDCAGEDGVRKIRAPKIAEVSRDKAVATIGRKAVIA